MKTKSTFMALAAMAMTIVFGSCDSDETISKDQFKISIAKDARLKVESGGRSLATSGSWDRGRADEDEAVYFFKKSHCPDLYKKNFPDQVLTKEECQNVYACIKEDAALIEAGMPAKYEVEKSSFEYKNFYIVNAHSAKDHDAKEGHSSVAGDMHDLGINGYKCDEFNTNTCTSADLVVTKDGLQSVTYDDSFGQKKESVTVDDWKLFYIEGYGYYVGMDYHSAKEDLHGDGEYSDWVIKLIPAVPDVDPIDETNGSVEINLSVNDEHETGDYIATKLSIHIRALTDAEVFIPVDKKYYCEADDMDISLSHHELNVVYNTQPQTVTKEIGGKDVTFTVQYEDGGIRIITDGVCKEVIDFCADQYADGITFEVWNYFKDITREQLKEYLDASTVTFESNPVVYVNAFAKIPGYSATPVYSKFNEAGQLVPYTDEECTKPLDQKYWTRETPDSKDYIFVGEQNPWDCTVAPVETSFKKTEQDPTDVTLSNYNVVYTLDK